MRIVGLLMAAMVPATGVALLALACVHVPEVRIPLAVMFGICAISGIGVFLVSRS